MNFLFFLFWEKFASTIGEILIKAEQNRRPAWVRVAVQACWRSRRNRSTGCAVRSTPDAHVVQYSATKWPKQQTAIIYHILWLRCGNKIANKRHNSFDSETESECECERAAAEQQKLPPAHVTRPRHGYVLRTSAVVQRVYPAHRARDTTLHYPIVLCECVCVRALCVQLSLGG